MPHQMDLPDPTIETGDRIWPYLVSTVVFLAFVSALLVWAAI